MFEVGIKADLDVTAVCCRERPPCKVNMGIHVRYQNEITTDLERENKRTLCQVLPKIDYICSVSMSPILVCEPMQVVAIPRLFSHF
jgi:hypothetical protein